VSCCCIYYYNCFYVSIKAHWLLFFVYTYLSMVLQWNKICQSNLTLYFWIIGKKNLCFNFIFIHSHSRKSKSKKAFSNVNLSTAELRINLTSLCSDTECNGTSFSKNGNSNTLVSRSASPVPGSTAENNRFFNWKFFFKLSMSFCVCSKSNAAFSVPIHNL